MFETAHGTRIRSYPQHDTADGTERLSDTDLRAFSFLRHLEELRFQGFVDVPGYALAGEGLAVTRAIRPMRSWLSIARISR